MVLFLCSCEFLDTVCWTHCSFDNSFICSFIRSFIIICVSSAYCADAVFISREREKSMTGTAPNLMDLTSPQCPLAASPRRTDQAIAALSVALVAQSVKGPQVAPESMWQVSPGCCPGAAGWGWVGVVIKLFTDHLLSFTMKSRHHRIYSQRGLRDLPFTSWVGTSTRVNPASGCAGASPAPGLLPPGCTLLGLSFVFFKMGWCLSC